MIVASKCLEIVFYHLFVASLSQLGLAYQFKCKILIKKVSEYL